LLETRTIVLRLSGGIELHLMAAQRTSTERNAPCVKALPINVGHAILFVVVSAKQNCVKLLRLSRLLARILRNTMLDSDITFAIAFPKNMLLLFLAPCKAGLQGKSLEKVFTRSH
jgi:hypothetical protein